MAKPDLRPDSEGAARIGPTVGDGVPYVPYYCKIRNSADTAPREKIDISEVKCYNMYIYDTTQKRG